MSYSCILLVLIYMIAGSVEVAMSSSSSSPSSSSSSSSAQKVSHHKPAANKSSSRSSLVRLNKDFQPDAQMSSRLQNELTDLMFYKNEPPLFLIHTRDFVVDVAKYYPGKKVTTMQATDGDGDQLEYFLRQAVIRDAFPYFTINSTSGELRLSSRPFQFKVKPNQESLAPIEGDEDSYDSADDADRTDEHESGEDSTPNLYFLDVTVTDGHYNTTIELKIHLKNSAPTQTPMSALKAVTAVSTTTLAAEEIDHIQTMTTMIPPLLAGDHRVAPPAVAVPAPAGVSDTATAQQHLAAKTPEPMMISLIIVCSCLMIALVLLMFIIPLSVKRLRKRLKHVELQHEHLSQKNSSVSSSCISQSLSSSSTLATHTNNNHHHHPSLSQFTLGSDSSSCIRRESIFRQSSLDSAITAATLSLGQQQQQQQQHTFNRVNNGSIANPIYLHQQQQQQQLHHYGNNLHKFKPTIAASQQHRQPTMLGYQHPPPGYHPQHYQQQQHQQHQHRPDHDQPSAENVYYPLDDEFYSTIQTETTGLDSASAGQLTAPNGEDSIQGFTASASNYLMAQCAQPTDSELERRPLESPAGSDASSLRSLARFLSLPPARYHQHKESQRQESSLRQLEEMQLAGGNGLSFQQEQDNFQSQKAAAAANSKTIARTCHIEREQQNGARRADNIMNSGCWELERHKLRVLDLLDEGQFGQVWRYKLSYGPRQPEQLVAVKSLKKSASKDERGREELLAEIEIMKLVCQHPNVVKILHCCTSDVWPSNDKPILLVMEYVERGKLQSYLERSRLNHHYASSLFDQSTMQIHFQQRRPCAGAGASDYLTSHDLMKFIYHVAKGMEYVSSKCIVHRDLASRNILVSAQKICKIGDFGMARHMQSAADVYERHSGNCKIPVRWMAPEVLLSNSCTTKSDVFSFGILMWEIVTLGSTPYTHLKTEQVIDRVARNGERPVRPEYCHSQLYDIMSRCWLPEPSERPSFKDLVDILNELVLSANNYIELDQYPDHDYYNIPKTAAPDELL